MRDETAPSWQPNSFVRMVRSMDTSMRTAEIETDVGRAYVKALGNPEGPHCLACEWVATKLAKWFHLQTFDVAILVLSDDDEIEFRSGGCVLPGPAFVARSEKSLVKWSGDSDELKRLSNPQDIARLVVFDTWTLNCDRHFHDEEARRPNYDNVFLSSERAPLGRVRLVAMDHTHCFTCGRELSERIATVERIKDDRTYGMFPAFVPWVKQHRKEFERALGRLREFDSPTCERIVESIPEEWEVTRPARRALVKLICRRALFVADNLLAQLKPRLWPQECFKFRPKEDKK